MTIGVGFSGLEGTILCSDMEISGLAKYKGIKDYQACFPSQGIIAAIYSGLEDDMRCVWEELNLKIGKQMNSSDISANQARTFLEESLRKVIKNKNSKFQMLVSISKFPQIPIYLRVFQKRVVPGASWEIIGVGDCELSRYLSSFMQYPHLTLYQAMFWASYIVNVARSFVQGVGQGVRITAITAKGMVHYMDGEILSKKMAEAEDVIKGMWLDFCNVTVTQEEFRKRSEAVYDRLLSIRGRLPLILDEK